MSKNNIYKLISLAMSLGVYNNVFDDYIDDEKVNDCLTELYFTMLCDIEIKKDEHYSKFEKIYNELNEEQQEIVKKEIAKILDIEYKPKIKKKER